MKKISFILFILSTVHSYAQTDVTLAANTENFNNVVFRTTNISNDMSSVRRNSAPCMNGWIIGSYVFGFAGGALIGYPLGTAIGGGDPEWILLAPGAGLVAIAIVFEIIGKKKCNGFVYKPKEHRSIYTVKEKAHQLGVVAKGNTVGLSLSL